MLGNQEFNPTKLGRFTLCLVGLIYNGRMPAP